MKFTKDGKFLYILHELKKYIVVYTYKEIDNMPEFEKIQSIPTIKEEHNDSAACAFNFSTDDSYLISSNAGDETSGYLTLWKVSAKNSYETKATYTAQFIADNGRVFAPYGNDIWNRLVQEKNSFCFIGETESTIELESNERLNNNLHAIFHRMETEIQNGIQARAEKKLRAIGYVEHRIKRIGIDNIRRGKMRKLQAEKEEWNNAFTKGRSVVPDVNHILTIRIDG